MSSFISFNTQNINANNRMTSLSLGEEGGGSATTMAEGEEGGGQVTTMAFGEEGGNNCWPPNNNCWPPRITFFWGECGGGDVPPLPGVYDNGANKNTNLYINFQQSADTKGDGDGKLTREEAQNEIERYKGQLGALEQIGQVLSEIFPPWLISGFLQAASRQLKEKIKVGERLFNNFDLFLDRPGGAPPPDDFPVDNTIEVQDIWKVAYYDRNPYDLTNRDLNEAYRRRQILPPSPPPPAPLEPAPESPAPAPTSESPALAPTTQPTEPEVPPEPVPPSAQ